MLSLCTFYIYIYIYIYTRACIVYISLVVVTLFSLCALRVLPIRVRFSEFCGYWGGIGFYRLWVIEVVVSNGFNVDVVSVPCIKMCSFFEVMYNLHGLIHGAE